MQAAVVTFNEHPQTVMTGMPMPLLTTNSERITLLNRQGLDKVFAFSFPVIRLLTAEQFLKLLAEQYGVRLLLMGYDHRFGSDMPDDFGDYQKAAHSAGIEALLLPQAPEGRVSSSAIRKALMAGDISAANRMLGYPYTLSGEVVRGRGIGRTIGFPTANINVPEEKLLPGEGVYMVGCRISDDGNPKSGVPAASSSRKGLLNIGHNPTVGGGKTTVELHIPGFSGDIYGRTVTVCMKSFIRPDMRFGSTEELRRQIRKDIDFLQQNLA